MRRAAEIIAFLGLSAMVHAGVMMGFGNSPGGSQAQGDTGADQITLAAAPDSMAALAARWAEPPQAAASLVDNWRADLLTPQGQSRNVASDIDEFYYLLNGDLTGQAFLRVQTQLAAP